MIEIRIFSQADGKMSGFSVTGHSGTAERGQDIVCAGVSSLTQTALLGIMEYLHREVDYDIASGKLTVKLKSDPDDLTEAIMQSMLLGLIEIQKLSPEAVRISR
ncbi:hypothetical protein SAMN02910356_01884 [Selenomonas sp. GACV-9]|uniref:ribosomal-processing cysteine protease Prp n=1 Tax=Selenomonas sp. GACV-9 TaxID=3158782 RepID=UPI0008E3DDEE|nr:hypothetical protein SAMN02910356_01884 [Selenomonas ruminantium]